MGKLVKEKWTPVDPTPVKTEQHVHRTETIRSTLVPALLAIRAPGARLTSTNAPPPCPAGMGRHASTPMEVTLANARKVLKVVIAFSTLTIAYPTPV